MDKKRWNDIEWERVNAPDKYKLHEAEYAAEGFKVEKIEAEKKIVRGISGGSESVLLSEVKKADKKAVVPRKVIKKKK